eukprot:scaffold131770_cov28-Tisochrysis_lutea.AAC.1
MHLHRAAKDDPRAASHGVALLLPRDAVTRRVADGGVEVGELAVVGERNPANGRRGVRTRQLHPEIDARDPATRLDHLRVVARSRITAH